MRDLAAVASVVIAALALFGAYMGARERALRRADVLAWANEGIDQLQTLLLVCILRRGPDGEAAEVAAGRIAFRTSCLVERGRLFFRNQLADGWGMDKPRAYQGHRPLILDHLIVAHLIACAWPRADEPTRLRMRAVAEDALKGFVTRAQAEVGRSRTASADTRQPGRSVELARLLSEVDEARLHERRSA